MQAVSRFKMEAGLGLTLRHRNIARIYHVGSERVEGLTIHFLVQEYMEGQTLDSLIKEAGPLSDPFLRKIGLQIAEALHQIHGRDIIHRDLKPENVFLESDGNVKVVDFGFSHVERGIKGKGSASGFLGSVAYAAPERFGPSPISRESDLYSLGVILFELAAGTNPFLAQDLTSTIYNHTDLIPKMPDRSNQAVSPFMERIIMALLEKEPAKRLGPASRLVRILKNGEMSRWWKQVRPEAVFGQLSRRRRHLVVTRRTPIFGRERELSMLRGLLDEVSEGKGCRTVSIHGEAGSGKTRLIDGLLEQMDALERPGRLLLVEGAQGEVKVPYLPLVSALQAAFDLRGLDDRDDLRSALQGKLLEMLPERSAVVERFVGFLISILPESTEFVGSLQPRLTAKLFGELFAALAENEPLILVIENILEADQPTFRVISQMLYHLENIPVLFIVTMRPEESGLSDKGNIKGIDTLLKVMQKTGGGHRFELGRLRRSTVSKLLCEVGFLEKVASGPFGERIFSITEGNPYFVLEIAKLILDESGKREGERNWQNLIEAIPSSIQYVFYRRLFRLPPLERRFLDFASVIGTRFKLAEVEEGLELDFREAVQAVSRLQNQYALIRPRNGLYRFDHVLIRDLLYNSLDPERRIQYHRRLGEHYESLGEERVLTGRECYKACVHFSKGRDPNRTLEYFQRAFDYLRYKHFHDKAYQLAEGAVGHMAELGREGKEVGPDFKCDTYLKQAEVAGFLGSREVQFQALKAALNAIRGSDAPKLMALVRLRIGQYYFSTSRFISSLSFVESSLAQMRRLNDRRGEADALQALGLIMQSIGDGKNVMKCLRQALAIRIELNDRAEQAGIRVNMAQFLLIRKRVDGARAVLAGRFMCQNMMNTRIQCQSQYHTLLQISSSAKYKLGPAGTQSFLLHRTIPPQSGGISESDDSIPGHCIIYR